MLRAGLIFATVLTVWRWTLAHSRLFFTNDLQWFVYFSIAKKFFSKSLMQRQFICGEISGPPSSHCKWYSPIISRKLATVALQAYTLHKVLYVLSRWFLENTDMKAHIGCRIALTDCAIRFVTCVKEELLNTFNANEYYVPKHYRGIKLI